MKKSSLPGFYTLTPDRRLEKVSELTGLGASPAQSLRAGLPLDIADALAENIIGTFALPLGVATNFRINGQDILVPMVTEEPSVIAAASAGAKAADNIEAGGPEPHITGQIQVLDPLPDAPDRLASSLIDIEGVVDGALSNHMSRVGISWDVLADDMMKVEIVVSAGEAMGANAVNGMCEKVAPLIQEITGGRVLLRILSNDIPATAYARAYFDVDSNVACGIVDAYRFALLDKARSVTHNKGIMNGISAVGMATGQDIRALEAGAHAFAADMVANVGAPRRASAKDPDQTSRYGPLTRWEMRDGRLYGALTMPLRVGTVGGLTVRHPVAAACLKMLGNPTARQLAGIMVAVGLCQNFSALRALATDGIQKGHMKLHHRRLE